MTPARCWGLIKRVLSCIAVVLGSSSRVPGLALRAIFNCRYIRYYAYTFDTPWPNRVSARVRYRGPSTRRRVTRVHTMPTTHILTCYAEDCPKGRYKGSVLAWERPHTTPGIYTFLGLATLPRFQTRANPLRVLPREMVDRIARFAHAHQRLTFPHRA